MGICLGLIMNTAVKNCKGGLTGRRLLPATPFRRRLAYSAEVATKAGSYGGQGYSLLFPVISCYSLLLPAIPCYSLLLPGIIVKEVYHGED